MKLTKEQLERIEKEADEAIASTSREFKALKQMDLALRTAMAKRKAKKQGKEFDGKLEPSTLPWAHEPEDDDDEDEDAGKKAE